MSCPRSTMCPFPKLSLHFHVAPAAFFLASCHFPPPSLPLRYCLRWLTLGPCTHSSLCLQHSFLFQMSSWLNLSRNSGLCSKSQSEKPSLTTILAFSLSLCTPFILLSFYLFVCFGFVFPQHLLSSDVVLSMYWFIIFLAQRKCQLTKAHTSALSLLPRAEPAVMSTW